MRIKELLKEKHYTQQELADKMNVSLSAVRQMVAAESLTTATLERSLPPSTFPCGSYSRPRKRCSFPQTPILSNAHTCGNEFPVSVNVELKTK